MDKGFESDTNYLGEILKCQYNIVGCMQKYCETIKTIQYNKYLYDLCYFYLCKILICYSNTTTETQEYIEKLFETDNLHELRKCIEDSFIKEPSKEIIIFILGRVISNNSLSGIRARYEFSMLNSGSIGSEV